MNIAVYLGSREGHNPIYKNKIQELGTWIGKNRHCLVYGGSKNGLMGVLASSVLEAGGTVIGVEPEFFVAQDFQMNNLTELIVTKDMQSRRAKMMELADIFIAFPGGIGTMEEISEVICAGSLGKHHKRYGFYNIHHFYDSMKNFYDQMVEEGFLTEENRNKIAFWHSLKEIEKDILLSNNL